MVVRMLQVVDMLQDQQRDIGTDIAGNQWVVVGIEVDTGGSLVGNTG